MLSDVPEDPDEQITEELCPDCLEPADGCICVCEECGEFVCNCDCHVDEDDELDDELIDLDDDGEDDEEED